MSHPVRIAQDIILAIIAVIGTASVVLVAAMLIWKVSPTAVISGSMEPTIKTGAVNIAIPENASEVKVGDIVTVPRTAGDGVVTHRVVATKQVDGSLYELTLKGDANKIDDPEHYQVLTVEKHLFSVPYAGYVVMAVQHYPVPAGVVLLVLLVFSFWNRTRITVTMPNGEVLKNLTKKEARQIRESYQLALDSGRQQPADGHPTWESPVEWPTEPETSAQAITWSDTDAAEQLDLQAGDTTLAAPQPYRASHMAG